MPNVIVFDPSMPHHDPGQAELDCHPARFPNQFGAQRYAIFFAPGTYGSSTDPLTFQVGYYTQVAGLGVQPADVMTGAIDRVQRRLPIAPAKGGACDGLVDFWRSLSNLTLNFTPLSFSVCKRLRASGRRGPWLQRRV